MKLRRAVLTAAGPDQRGLSLEPIIDRDGIKKPVLRAQLEEVFAAGLEEAVVVLAAGEEEAFLRAAGNFSDRLVLVEQSEPKGYAQALALGLDTIDGEACLHLVGDHLFVSDEVGGVARALIETANRELATVCAVRPTREHALTEVGVVGGEPVAGRPGLFEVRRVVEKPTPTLAEQELLVPGLRAGHYLGFFGMHVLSPSTVEAVSRAVRDDGRGLGLSEVLDEVARTQRVLALEAPGRRFDLGERYGAFAAQLAIGLEGVDREVVLDTVSRVLLERERRRAVEGGA